MKTIYVTQTLLGKILDNITPRWIQMLGKRGIFKKSSNGKYDLLPNVTAYIKFLKQREDSQTIEEVKKRHLETKTKKLSVEVDQLEGNLVPKAKFQQQLEAHVLAAQQAFRNLPSKLVPVLQQIKDDEDGKFMAYAIDYCIKDIIRHDLAGVPKSKTASIQAWDRDLVRLGLIKGDHKGEVILQSSVFPYKKKVKVADLLSDKGFDEIWHGRDERK